MRSITDLHCHLLPGLDDGARNLTESLRMLEMAAASGVGRIVCTPHLRMGDPLLEEKGEAIRWMVNYVQAAAAREMIPVEAFPGAEVLWGGHSGNLDTLRRLTLAGSRYLLVEFSFRERLSQIEFAAGQVANMGLVPVLAHPERYEAVQRDSHCIAEWFRNGWVIQLDKGSVLGDFGQGAYQASAWVLEHGFAHVVASDAHNLLTRTASFVRLEQFLTQRYSLGCAELLLRRNPGRMVEGAGVVKG